MGYSRFYLSDLQVHTPADRQHRYGDVGGREPNESFAQQLVQAHADAGVEVITVTDHNRVDWYPFLRAAGMKVGLTVFPGLEFSVNGCHLLAIWDPTDAGFALAGRFANTLFEPGVKPFVGNGDPRPVTRGQVIELARDVVDHKGLVFAPHATERRMGLFGPGVCSNSPEVAQSDLVAGFDVCGNSRADVLTNPRSEFGDVPPRWFMSGDTRSLADVAKGAVYLKLGGTPTLEGIRQAFLAPATRIRFPRALEPKWKHVEGVRFIDSPEPSWPRLGSVRIDGGFHDQLRVEFGPGLNAIIGGKGTGKSALIEIIRHVLERPVTRNEELRQNRLRNFGANADAAIAFVDDEGAPYEVRRSGGSARARLFRDGEESDVRVVRRITARVFGQRELQTLAEDTGELRAFVAGQAGSNWSTAVDEEDTILATLEAVNEELDGLERDLARLVAQEEELVDLRERLDRAMAQGIELLLQQSEALARADRAVQHAIGWPATVREATKSLRGLLPRPDLPSEPPPPETLGPTLEQVATAVTAAASALDATTDAAASSLDSDEKAWAKIVAHGRDAVERALADAGIKNPHELAKLQTRVAELEEAIATLPQRQTRAGEMNAERSTQLGRLGEVRRRKSRLVDEAARRLNHALGPRVRVRVHALLDRSMLQEALENAVRGQSVRGDQITKLANLDPVDIATAARGSVDAVVELGVTATTANKLVELAAGVLRDIEQVDVPDRVELQINRGTRSSEDWQAIDQLSPGQRATALLALAMAAGDEPLIIDQPEDDLDNRYIFAEVVQVLARVCEGRQVIVATHNANIPILGDAEMVVALDAVADRSRVLASGGLEDPDVASFAKQILEGGDEAFRARQRRYLAAQR